MSNGSPGRGRPPATRSEQFTREDGHVAWPLLEAQRHKAIGVSELRPPRYVDLRTAHEDALALLVRVVGCSGRDVAPTESVAVVLIQPRLIKSAL